MSKPLRVLLVEDSEQDAELIVCELQRGGYDVIFERVQTAEAMKLALEGGDWDMVLSDYSLPGFSGTGALELLTATGRDLPFIVISGTIGEETAVASLKAGAHDFLTKGHLARLLPAIAREQQDLAERRERRRAQNALRHLENQHRSLVEHAVFGIYQSTLEGRFLMVNPALVNMLGYESTRELLDVDEQSLYAEPDAAVAILRRMRETGQITGEEAMWRRKNGDLIRVRLSGRLASAPPDERLVVEVFVEDVTERHRLEAQLRQAQKMEAIGQLAGGVAHDFNNMLTAILGYTALLTDQIGPEEPIGQDLREISGAAQRAAALTKQLLAFSRQQTTPISALDVTKAVQNIDALLRRLIGEQIRIKTALADDLHSAMAETSLLDQMLINLCVNARDAMPEGGTLTIEARNVEIDQKADGRLPEAKSGSFVRLSVSDTGTGMSPEVRARIFEPFFTTKERGRGTGLGLAAVYGTVKQLGGFITVDSAPGCGSTFHLHLPKADGSLEAPLAELSKTTNTAGNETVLLVEDEDSVRSFVKLSLKRHGYRVIDAHSGERALTLLESNGAGVQVLLTDLILPGIDGRELAARITRKRPHVRVLYMSGYMDRVVGNDTGGPADAGTSGGFATLGSLGSHLGRDRAIQLLEKPFTAQTLLRRLRQLLEPSGIAN
jgi:two-component system cell cycle sensor histidine kinase/response regulator CckA